MVPADHRRKPAVSPLLMGNRALAEASMRPLCPPLSAVATPESSRSTKWPKKRLLMIAFFTVDASRSFADPATSCAQPKMRMRSRVSPLLRPGRINASVRLMNGPRLLTVPLALIPPNLAQVTADKG